jgi:hypothetical protein
MTSELAVRSLPGPGVVARAGDLLLVCAEGGAEVDGLLNALTEVAAAHGDGVSFVRRVAAVLASALVSDMDGGFPACAAGGPARDGGYAVLVWGAALAEVASASGDVSLTATDAVTPVTRLVAEPTGWVRLQVPGAGPAHPRSRLDAGVVDGAGLIRGLDSGGTSRAVPVSPPSRPPVNEPPRLRQPDPAAPFEAVLLVPGAQGARPVEPPAPIVDNRVRVPGVLCKNGHFNDPSVNYCAICGISMAQQTLAQFDGPRPPLGLLLLDDGSTYRLDTDYLAGRDPGTGPDFESGLIRPLRIRDSDGLVSRRHLRIALVGWDVHVVDLGSANGTFVTLPNDGQRRQLVAHEPLLVRPGARVDLGRRWLRYESNRNP